MVQINRLRLSGFKSFVDKTELDIGGGLNGIVGPNGCGKSNLVEALRWVMGENRAKQMRGGEMEDVIFAGTTARPARAIAEVSLILDNTDGRAPAPFGNVSQIEVTRRIERDKGSQYLVNGKVVRARDVQMLFADSLTGAHSPALVSQGRVTQLIQAKPTERRMMLEESAGVASLYTRRHEAELRLKAADENLARLDLVLGEMMSRANTLRNQAGQAVRYRDLSENIRRLEALLAWQDWAGTRERLKKEDQRFNETDAVVRDALAKASSITVASTDALEAVEETRKTETEARAALQLIRQTAEQMEREVTHRRNEYNDLTRQLEQAQNDLHLASEQRNALADRAAVIKVDLEKIANDDAGAPAELAGLDQDYNAAQAKVRENENNVLTLQDRIRRTQSERDAARETLNRAQAQAEKTAAQLAQLEEQYAAIAAPAAEEEELAEILHRVEALKAERTQAEDSLQAAQQAADSARAELNTARDALASLQQERDLKGREIKTLTALAERLSEGFENSLLLGLDIPADLARAVAAAAGDAAMRASSTEWAGSNDAFHANDWPQGITPLASLMSVPDNLKAFISSIGVADADRAENVATSLRRGQIAVTREGALYRWDGLRAPPSASEDAQSRAVTLRAQIRDAEKALADLEPGCTQAESALQDISAKRDVAVAHAQSAQMAVKDLANELYAAENRAGTLQKSVNDRSVRRTLLSEQRNAAVVSVESAQNAAKDAQAHFETLESGTLEDTLRSELAGAESVLSESRQARDEISVKIETVKASAAQVKHLRESLEGEAKRTDEQIARGETHTKSLQARIDEVAARKNTLEPQVQADETGTSQHVLLNRIADAETTLRDASDRFVEADARAKALQSELKKAEEEGAAAREKRAVIQATVAALQTEQTRIATEIEERFSTSPAALENAVITDWPEGTPSVSKAKSERDFLNRERDAMGPVNLRAELELTETETEHARLEAEKIDLAAAIERLREGIGTLNMEARERITKTFDAVNTHFQHLFKRLFGGGEAYLKLEGAEDPLECGLEIYAQPPGKHLQSLNLLSGGEQTLTALSMIFAMFLSNPAPVCVLDEVDAPLDDANVDRVCGLLEEMAASCATRFLIITHHRMTMARMDRLYGVTMAERGVSQLVSVNLAAQGDFLEQHKVA